VGLVVHNSVYLI